MTNTGRETGATLAAGSAEEGTDALAVADRLRPVLLRIYRHMREEGAGLGVTTMQASILASIAKSPGIGLGELAHKEHVTPQTLVMHIDRLAGAGMVERRRDEAGDKRRVGLTVTEAGQGVITALRERRTAWLAARLETLAPEALAAVAAAIEPLRLLVQR